MRTVPATVVGAMLTVATVTTAWSAEEAAGVLSAAELRAEMRRNERLREHVMGYGYPDVAARQPLPDADPWEEYQVTLYYLDTRRRLSFARARLLGKPVVQLEKSDQPLSDEDLDALRPLVQAYGAEPAGGGSPVERAEAAALRSEAAAARVEAAAERAERAAGRAEAVADRLAAGQRRARRR